MVLYTGGAAARSDGHGSALRAPRSTLYALRGSPCESRRRHVEAARLIGRHGRAAPWRGLWGFERCGSVRGSAVAAPKTDAPAAAAAEWELAPPKNVQKQGS